MTVETKAVETIEVDVHGIKIPLPKDQAEKLILARDADKASRRELADNLGKLTADKTAAEQARAKAEEDKQILEHAGKKEVEQIRALASKESADRMAKISAKLRDKHLAASLAAHHGIVSAAIPDIHDQLKNRLQYDAESDAVVVLDGAGQPQKDEAGKPVQVDTWIGDWLAKRPHYLLDKTAQGNGGTAVKTTTGKTVPAATFEAMTTREKALFCEAGGGISG